ncbi:MAG TPA: hypothetical protein VJ570_09295 [Holophagaceae bacterium]|nr:hypothetical protein [Holophagaceae bacterium]
MRPFRPTPFLFVALGVLGLAGYELALRATHAPFLASDAVHGGWMGLCIGLEILGLLLLRRQRNRPGA